MSFTNKVKRAFYNPYVAIMKNPYETAFWAGLLASTALYVGGLMFFATPEILSVFIAAGVYTTTGLAILAAFAVTIGLTFLCFAIKDPGLQEALGTSVLTFGGIGMYEMAEPLVAALAATNPLIPLIILGVVAAQIGAFISMGITALVTSIFNIKPWEYEYIKDDERDAYVDQLYGNDYNNDYRDEHNNSNEKINALLPAQDNNPNNNNDWKKIKVEEPAIFHQPPVPQYHDGLNVAPGQEIEQNHEVGYHIDDGDAALVVPRL